MNILRYNLIFRPEPEGGFTVTVPALPGCVTYGKTLEEARLMARDAIEAYIEDVIADGEKIPQPETVYIGEVDIPFPHKRTLLHVQGVHA